MKQMICGIIAVMLLAAFVCLFPVAASAAESPDYLAVKAAFDGSQTAMADAKKLKRSVDGYQNVVPSLTTNNEVRAYLAAQFAAKGWIVGVYTGVDDLFDLRIPASDTPLTDPDRVILHRFLRDVEEASGHVYRGV